MFRRNDRWFRIIEECLQVLLELTRSVRRWLHSHIDMDARRRRLWLRIHSSPFPSAETRSPINLVLFLRFCNGRMSRANKRHQCFSPFHASNDKLIPLRLLPIEEQAHDSHTGNCFPLRAENARDEVLRNHVFEHSGSNT